MACFYSRNETLDTETGSYINRFWWYVLLEGVGKNTQAAYVRATNARLKKNIQSIQSKVAVWVFMDFCAKLLLLLCNKAKGNFRWKI